MTDVVYDYTGTPPTTPFPPVSAAIDSRLGLMAVGGDWHPDRIVTAYRAGIFPWPMHDIPLGWYCPPVRMIFDTAVQPPGRRFRKSLKGLDWTVTADTAFVEVLHGCATVARPGQEGGTWIHDELIDSYTELHRRGVTHSLEVWDGSGRLIGGLFGVCVRNTFCGDSMFSLVSGASRVAFGHLCRFLHANGIEIIDGQVPNEYLIQLGGRSVMRSEFLAMTQTDEADSVLAHTSWKELFGVRTLDAIR